MGANKIVSRTADTNRFLEMNYLRHEAQIYERMDIDIGILSAL